MKRKNLKPMIISALLAVGFGATSVGTSFALFTDHADTSISVTAGKVDVDFSLANLAKTSADAGADVKTMTDENGAQYGEQAGWVNGGDATFNPTTGFLDLDRMTPGDKVAFGASFKNSSNVAIKYRLVIQAEDTSDYLIKGLNFKVGETSIKALKTYKSAWTVLAAPAGDHEDVTLGAFAIELPITAGNAFQNLSTSYNIGIEAVQANALTEDDEEIIAGDLSIVNNVSGAKRFKLIDEFRDEVNNGETYEGWTAKLNDDVDLGGVNWVPIGTSAHPFKGVFDGQEHTIKNYKIRGAGKDAGLALFGFIEGTSTEFTYETSLSKFYNVTNYAANLPSEDVFTCVIKNVNVSGANVNTTADGWTAAVVSNVKNATISNVHVSSSTISGNEKVGGVAAYLPNNAAAYITNCSTANDVVISALTGNHAAGILGRVATDASRAVIANSINNATVNSAGVNGGGIAGQAKNVFYYNDVNNGAITSATRAAGIATDCSGSVFIDCKNTGYIKNTNEMKSSTDSSAGIAAYLATTGKNVIVNCINSGTIEGTTTNDNAKIAGIVAGGATQTDVILNNSNSGTLINHAVNGKTYDISNLSTVATEANASTVAEVVEELAKDNKYVKFTGNVTLSTNNVLSLNGQNKVEFVNSPDYLTIDLTNADANSFVLIANNTTINLKNGTQKNITISGKGNTIVLENGQSSNILTVMNDEDEKSSIEISGIIGKLRYAGVGKVSSEVKETGSLSSCHFNGTGTYVLTNKGTISHTQSETNPYGNEHTVSSINACDITIYNYGTIEAKENTNGVASYTFLFFNGSTVKIYAYAESKILAEGNRSVIATNGGTQTSVYYQEGAKVTARGKEGTYLGEFGYYCDVELIN